MSTNTIKFKGAVYAENTSIQVPSGTLYEVKELKSDSLEANSLSITVTSNDTSILKYKKNDKVEYFRDGKRKGIFYLQSVKRVGPSDYSLYGLSALGRLLQMKHVGGIYTGETVATVVQEICGSVPVIVETVYAKIVLYGYLPYADGVTTSARDNLAQVLFAIGAWLGTDENGVLRVEKLWDGTASTIGANRISSQNCNVEYLDPISSVEVVEHGYIPDTKEVTLFNGTAQANDLVVFSEPIHDLSATGFTILESGTNYAILSAGTGTLTGKGYLHSTRVIQRPVSVGVEENVLFVNGATLVSLVNSAAVTDRLVNYYKHREQISGIVDVSQERVGHVVNLYHPWDRTLVSACLSEREVSISGILEANTKALVGFLPPQPETTEYYNERVILTDSGEWTVPEGTTEVRVVLIGKGQDGTNGSAGYDSIMTSQTKNGSSGSFSATSPGLGGDGGVGGTGGKILEETIDVTAGQKIQYAAADNSDDSTFGSLSSADGTSSDTGYYDTVTQTYFGRKGADGKKGGNGGSPGNDGQAVGSFRGGYGRGSKTATDTDYGFTGQGSISGWGGGGAAQGSLGGQSSGGFRINLMGEFIHDNPSESRVTLDCGYSSGGKGANGANGKDGENYGDGGDGGHGGGGAGAIGTISLSFSPSGKSPHVSSGSGAWGSGGSAGTGGSGKPGCIILYYRKSKPINMGWLKDKNGKLVLERLDKRFIV